jgi:hypothetical protein
MTTDVIVETEYDTIIVDDSQDTILVQTPGEVTVLTAAEQGPEGPQGLTGPQGLQGLTGAAGPQGAIGPSNVLSIGLVQPGAVAAASITGTSPSQILNLVLPKGDKGDQGIQGLVGQKVRLMSCLLVWYNRVQ